MRIDGFVGRRFCLVSLVSVFIGVLVTSSANAAVVFSNGFEVDTTSWVSTTRVPSGTGGITSASGSYHAEAVSASKASPNSDTFGRWGGYGYGAGTNVPTTFQEYWTSVDIFLNTAGGWANDTRFDFTSAINNAAGTHLRDFIFNAGFYNDSDGSPGSGTSRFVITASNNTQRGSAFAKDPGRQPIAIAQSGWYTFEHHFYNNGGFLAVDMSIFTASDALVKTWSSIGGVTPGAGEAIATVGGNRYGWFDTNEFSRLAFDNSELRTVTAAVPEPLSLVVWPLIAITIGGLSWFRRYWSPSSAA
jgi:hypothetical protein